MKVYKSVLEENLPKLINLYNLDNLSDSYGYGDRLYWGWKVRDFCNATLQGGVHSLAIAIQLGVLKEQSFGLNLIDKAILAIDKIKDKSNSVVEAYPNEQSFCVTALVAFDVLSAIDILGDKISDSKKELYLSIVSPLIRFLEKNDEEHAIISNHIATAVAAIAIWNKYSNQRSERYKELLGVIYTNQSEEGWYKEYEGADPGYQTLCTYYLAVANLYLNSERLSESLNQSLEYLKYFIHPDGSIGGLYGSRNTEVFYPGGLAILAKDSPLARSILAELETGIEQGVHVTPQIIDIGNYAPLLNSYSYAAWVSDDGNGTNTYSLPHKTDFEIDFPHSGIYVHSNDSYYAIVNYKKGGTLKVLDKKKKILDIEDGGWVAKSEDGAWVSTQQSDEKQKFENHEIEASFYKSNEAYPSPFQFMILRFLAITVFRSNKLGNMFKRAVVKLLMTGKNKVSGRVRRKFDFNENEIRVSETIKRPNGFPNVQHGGKFKSIHMASSGYNTSQLRNAEDSSKFVAFHIEYED